MSELLLFIVNTYSLKKIGSCLRWRAETEYQQKINGFCKLDVIIAT